MDHRDTRFVYEIVYGVMRRRLTLDYVLAQFVEDPEVLKDSLIVSILEIGAYQILYMDRVPDHASVNESVNLAKLWHGSRHYSGLVNATLRNLIKDRKRIRLPDPHKELVTRLSVEFSHPEWMVKRWLERFGLSKTKLLLSFNNEKPDIFLRRKLHGLPKQQLETELQDLCDGASGYLNLFYRLRKPAIPEMIPLFKEGECTVQAPSSGWMVALLDVAAGHRVVDVCSAPGGKSALAAELAGASGRIIACEIRKLRMRLSVETFTRMHLSNVEPVMCNGTRCPSRHRLTGFFSMLGAPVRVYFTGIPKANGQNRKAILRSSPGLRKVFLRPPRVWCARVTFLYSTCSLEPEENEQVVMPFLAEHPEFTLDRSPAQIPASYLSGDGFLRITPYEHKLDGMFGARLLRTK